MRLKNIFRNSFFSLMSQFILIFVGFFSQRVMNLVMGESLIGMNSVNSNIIAILSVSELGIASAIVYHLYEALAVRDESRIASLMNLYRRAYCLFACVITTAGLCVMPFVHNFLKDNCFPLSYVRLIYCLWLVRTALSYLLSYKRSILIADQKEYIVSITSLVMNLLNYGLTIVILQFWQNYQLVLGLSIVVEAALNIWLIRYVDRKYPFLKRNRRMPPERAVARMLAGDIKNIFISRLSFKLLVSTDNLIIASFISVAVAGRYANYSMITQSIINIMQALSNAIQASVGDMLTEKNQEKNYQALRQITFLFFLMAACCSAGLMSLMTRFVTDFWLSEGYRMDAPVVVLCVMNVFLLLISLPTAMMMTASGMFEKERSISILYAAVNLIISLLLVKPLGLAGVLLGTAVSYTAQIVCRTYFFFRYNLKKNCAKYIADILQYGILVVVESMGTYYVVDRIYDDRSLYRFILSIFICVFLPCAVNLLIFIKSWRLQSMVRMAKGVFEWEWTSWEKPY